MSNTSAQTRILPSRRLAALVILAATLVALLAWSRFSSLEGLLLAVEQRLTPLGARSPFGFALFYSLCVLLMLPGSALSLLAGGMFGVVAGALQVTIGANLGAALAFLIARHLARDAIAARIHASPRYLAIDRAIGEGGWKVVALLRLSPLVPFNLQNYLYGLTRIGFWPCVLASALAMVPGTLLHVYLGYLGRAGLAAATSRAGSHRTAAEWAMLALGLLATLVVTIYVSRLAHREMQRITDHLDGETGQASDANQPASPGQPVAALDTPSTRSQ